MRPPSVVMSPFIVSPFMVSPLTALRPFMVRPFIVSPFMVRPFIVSPFMVRPFIVSPFSDASRALVSSATPSSSEAGKHPSPAKVADIGSDRARVGDSGLSVTGRCIPGQSVAVSMPTK